MDGRDGRGGGGGDGWGGREIVLAGYGVGMAGSGGRGAEAGRRHPGLSHRDVLASGGWHPRYARVLITASDGDYGFALVDGNGDGAELEEELWRWEDGGPAGHGHWEGGSSSGAGPLGYLPPLVAGGPRVGLLRLRPPSRA